MLTAISNWYLGYMQAWTNWYAAHPTVLAIGVIVGFIGGAVLGLALLRYVTKILNENEELKAKTEA